MRKKIFKILSLNNCAKEKIYFINPKSTIPLHTCQCTYSQNFYYNTVYGLNLTMSPTLLWNVI